MCERLYFRAVDFAVDIDALRFFRKDNRNAEVLCDDAGNADARCFYRQNFIDALALFAEKALEFLFKKPIFCYIYRVVFSLLTYVGATATLGVVWSFSDIANGLMAIPNLIGLIALSGSLAKETKDYHNKLKDEKVKTK